MDDLLAAIAQDDELSPQAQGDVYETLKKVLGNIANNPAEPKFRNLKKENRVVAEKLCICPAAISVLLALGFEDTGPAYLCPDDVDLGALNECIEVLGCIITSRGPVEQPAAPAAAPAAAAVPVTTPKTPAQASGPTNAAAAAKQFARRSDEDQKREDQRKELDAVRAAQKAQHGQRAQAVISAAPAPVPAPAAVKPQQEASVGVKKPQAPRSAFDFENRAVKEQQKVMQEQGLDDLRAKQKEKFKQFQEDPNARQSEAYQRPPSAASGGKVDKGWGDWLGGMFGGGGSSGSNGGGQGGGGGERRKPQMKTVADLPKPVQKG